MLETTRIVWCLSSWWELWPFLERMDVFLGLKIEIHEYNELRLKAGLSEIETPHISTTHICGGGFTRGVSSQSLEEKIILRKRSLEKVQRNITEQSLGEQKGGGEDQVGESPL